MTIFHEWKWVKFFRYLIKWPIFLYIFILLVGFGVIEELFLYDGMEQVQQSVSPKQASLLNEIRDVAKKPIKSVVIEPAEPPELSPKRFRKEIIKPFEMKLIGIFLNNATTAPPPGGHVQVPYECTLSFVTRDGLNLKVLAEVDSDKPNDAYLANNFYIRDKNGYFTKWGMKPIYVPGLGE
jgi:hypothetical protein